MQPSAAFREEALVLAPNLKKSPIERQYRMLLFRLTASIYFAKYDKRHGISSDYHPHSRQKQ